MSVNSEINGIKIIANVRLGCDNDKLLESLNRCKKVMVVKKPDGIVRTKTTIIGEQCEILL